METLFNVERVTRNGTCQYLMHVIGEQMEWSTDPDAAFEYTALREAQADAERYDGEVLTFRRPIRSSYHASGHKCEARLERHFSGAAE